MGLELPYAYMGWRGLIGGCWDADGVIGVSRIYVLKQSDITVLQGACLFEPWQ